jgi:hypothetical protein
VTGSELALWLGLSAGTQNHRDERTDLEGPAAATKEEQSRTHEEQITRSPHGHRDHPLLGPKLSYPLGKMDGMTSWQEFTAEVPEFAARAESRLAAFTHLTMATIRADGGPRISGTEIRIRGGELWLAGMGGARRFADLRRDPRVAIHSGSPQPVIPAEWGGDVKVSGRAREITAADQVTAFFEQEPEVPSGPVELFRIELAEVTWTGLNDAVDKLLIETWRPGRPVVRHER